MMHLRTLKKLSKRAAPYLKLLGDRREQFPAIKGENYHELVIRDRKCCERSTCHSTYKPMHDEIVFDTRAGNRVVLRPSDHPLKGTIMVGAVIGYYEPEWYEQTAFGALQDMVYSHYTDWAAEPPTSTRRIRNISEFFTAANDMIEMATNQ